MKTMYFHKHDDGETEYIDSYDIYQYLKEYDNNFEWYYSFVLKMAEYLNYFQNNTSTAFGNPDLAKLEGIVYGWCCGAGWEMDTNEDTITIYKGKRKLFVFDRPALPQVEINKRKEIDQMWSEVLG